MDPKVLCLGKNCIHFVYTKVIDSDPPVYVGANIQRFNGCPWRRRGETLPFGNSIFPKRSLDRQMANLLRVKPTYCERDVCNQRLAFSQLPFKRQTGQQLHFLGVSLSNECWKHLSFVSLSYGGQTCFARWTKKKNKAQQPFIIT